MQCDNIVTIPWEWTLKIFDLEIPNSLIVEPPETLKKMADRILDLAIYDARMWKELGKKFNDLSWTRRLLKLTSGSNRTSIPDIKQLIDDQRRFSNPPLAAAHRTMALMIAAWDVLGDLYLQLCHRAAEPDAQKPGHLEWAQLPVRVLLVGCLTLGSDSDEFHSLLNRVFETLAKLKSPETRGHYIFGSDVRAQACADLCALYLFGNPDDFEAYKKVLENLDVQESEAQLKTIHLRNIEHLQIVHQIYDSRGLVGLENLDFDALTKILPPSEEPWNLFSLVVLEQLSNLYEFDLLLPKQSSKLLRKATEFVRYFMSLICPGQFQWLQFPVGYLSKKLVAAAFMKLSAGEKIRFLQCYPPDNDWEFIKMIVDKGKLSTNEKLRLIDEILSQEPKSMDKVLGVLRNRRSLFQGPLSGQP